MLRISSSGRGRTGLRIRRSVAGRRRTVSAARARARVRVSPAARRKRRDSASKGEESRSSCRDVAACRRAAPLALERQREEPAREPLFFPRGLPPSKKIFGPLRTERQEQQGACHAGVRGLEPSDQGNTAPHSRRAALSECLQDAEAREKPEALCAAGRGRAEEFVELDEPPLFRHLSKKSSGFLHFRKRRRSDPKPGQVREEPRGPEDPQGILQEDPGPRRRQPPR